ncbi:MAG: exodeoxyribonuclease VII large subunit, partial [Pseudomonadota bacterium]
ALRPSLLRGALERKSQTYAGMAARLNLRALQREIDLSGTEFTRLARRLSEAGQRQLTAWQTQLGAQDRLRETLGYRATLARGYAVVRAQDAVLTSRAAAQNAKDLEIEFADGRLPVGAAAPEPAPTPRPAAQKPRKTKADSGQGSGRDSGQGSLF